MSAKDIQVSGDHYKNMKIQPMEYILANSIGFAEGAVIKYVSRWKNKNGIDDLKKARHVLDFLIEYEEVEKEAKENEDKEETLPRRAVAEKPDLYEFSSGSDVRVDGYGLKKLCIGFHFNLNNHPELAKEEMEHIKNKAKEGIIKTIKEGDVVEYIIRDNVVEAYMYVFKKEHEQK